MPPELPKIQEKLSPPTQPPRRWPKFLLAGFLILFFLSFAAVGAVMSYGKYYEGKVYPGVYVGSYHLGGMRAEELKNLIETLNNRLAKEGIDLEIIDKNGAPQKIKISNVITDADNAIELINLDSETLVRQALSYGRVGGATDWYAPLWLRWGEPIHLEAPLIIQTDRFKLALADALAPYEDRPHNATVKITALDPLAYDIISEKSGRMFDRDKIIDTLDRSLSQLSFAPIAVAAGDFSPAIVAADLAGANQKLSAVLNYGDLGLNFINPHSLARQDWNFDKKTLAQWIEASRDTNNNVVFSLNAEAVKDYLEKQVRPAVDEEPQNAKFTMENNKVKEFIASRFGLKLNTEKTYGDLNSAFIDRNNYPAQAIKTIGVTADVAEPDVALSKINDLGITAIIGSGTSTFFDSHSNRIKNIANAVARLNGTLILPGEEFSTIKSAGPFIAENGFLPEEVIKGDKIQKEIGGGMCQIGTTLFRMAMQSGMPITARRNHSLVVSYYADPVNHNPGTDATVYEPILDFKFLNDTGNYLLLQTNIDYKKQMLTFTLWGRPDGRSGSYTHPLVSRWIPAGEPKQTVSADLKPGEQKCQNAFRGAVASFTYTRTTPAGEKIDQVFDSYYRPLPKICMIGKKPDCALDDVACNAATSTASGVVEAD